MLSAKSILRIGVLTPQAVQEYSAAHDSIPMSSSRAVLPIIAEKKGSQRMNCSIGQTASPPPSHTGFTLTLAALLHGRRTKAPERVRDLLLFSAFYLQNEAS